MSFYDKKQLCELRTADLQRFVIANPGLYVPATIEVYMCGYKNVLTGKRGNSLDFMTDVLRINFYDACAKLEPFVLTDDDLNRLRKADLIAYLRDLHSKEITVDFNGAVYFRNRYKIERSIYTSTADKTKVGNPITFLINVLDMGFTEACLELAPYTPAMID